MPEYTPPAIAGAGGALAPFAEDAKALAAAVTFLMSRTERRCFALVLVLDGSLDRFMGAESRSAMERRWGAALGASNRNLCVTL